ncbi:Retrovirus-related Pol polyprotein from transposon 412 [Merluccius polli]|uniref:Gypsy retrotransposon integrase-like protein 1 n=1 Tax=Merluccius polli TaxID=89951 RepID=A0AA47NR92_MERPO|nr:Retrovirus-related Pol polyprotein from transposon 412 [Merluccius polli]
MGAYDDFLDAPSESLLVALTKEQLLNVAEHYLIELTVPKSAKKEQLVWFICERLKELKVLPGVPGGAPSEPSKPVVVPTAPLSEMAVLTFEQQKELLQMQFAQKELELGHEREQRKWEIEQELERQKIAADVKEKDRLWEMEKLKHAEREQEQAREFECARLRLMAEGRATGNSTTQSSLASMVKFIPKFNERDPDIFFSLFENVADTQNWDDGDKTLLLQAVLIGHGQEAFVALSSADRKSYQLVKEAVLKSYELIPEAYRQRFRNCRKSDRQTHAELARDLNSFFHRWLTSEGVDTFDGLCDLLVLEQFKDILPERIATYLNEHELKTAAKAAVLADGYVLTHKIQVRRFSPRFERKEYRPGFVNAGPPARPDPMKFDPALPNKIPETDANTCHYCFEVGHWKRLCPALKARKNSKEGNVKAVAFVSSISATHVRDGKSDVSQLKAVTATESKSCERLNGQRSGDEPAITTVSDYAPFITEGYVSMVGDARRVPVKILRDTGASESFIHQSALPFSSVSDTGSVVLIRGIGLQSFPVPLHRIQLFSGFVDGDITIAVRPSLPMEGIDMIIGNNIGRDCVFPEQKSPLPVVMKEVTSSVQTDGCLRDFPEVFTACAVTRAMARVQNAAPSEVSRDTVARLFIPEVPAPLSCAEVIEAQKNDDGLKKYFALALDDCNSDHGYCVQNGLLFRRPCADNDVADGVMQLVMPDKFRALALQTAHGGMSGHFGVKKTYSRLLRQFYWPRVRRDVARLVKSCHVCQIAGKPNMVIKPTPLQPIPSVGTPFEHLIIDCVGPLPQSKSGNIYLFTIMCQATRYPAAYALRSITTRSVVKCLSQFISIFGLPKIIQSDHGSNFTSRTFAAALKQLRIQHNMSSAYHAQSQGALERFHATLKSLLRAYCVEMKREWEDGLPWLLLAARAVVQESTGFSPNELVFGHEVRTSLSVLSGDMDISEPLGGLADYVQGFRRRLFLAWKMARDHLTEAQKKMKRQYDQKTEVRTFSPGDQVVALLPIPGSPFGAKYSGPYTVTRKVSETNYVVATPERRRSTQLCHVNLLKPYYSSQVVDNSVEQKSVGFVVVQGAPEASPVAAEDDVRGPDDAVLRARLNNSQTLAELDDLLGLHWSRDETPLKQYNSSHGPMTPSTVVSVDTNMQD